MKIRWMSNCNIGGQEFSRDQEINVTILNETENTVVMELKDYHKDGETIICDVDKTDFYLIQDISERQVLNKLWTTIQNSDPEDLCHLLAQMIPEVEWVSYDDGNYIVESCDATNFPSLKQWERMFP